MNHKTNILFISSDQHRFDCVGLNSTLGIRTPNLDALNADGMNFTNAYTPCPVCTPARASMLTGMWSFRHHSITIPQWTEVPCAFDDGLPTFSELLQKEGYYLGYTGKWHVDSIPENRPQPEDVGFSEYIPEDQYYKWRQGEGLPLTKESSWAAGHPIENAIGYTDTGINPEQSKLHWGAEHTIRMIEECSKNEKPFFIRWDPSEPHLPNVVPEPYASMYNPDEIKPWGSFGDTFEGKPYIQKQQLNTWKTHHWTWEEWAPIVARYMGEITLLDHQIGRVLDKLESLGLADNTVVIYTTDHGDMCGSHGMIDKHYVMYDDVVRVPLIIRWPQVVKADSQCSSFVSHAIDLASTICEIGGCTIPDTFQGKSLLSLFNGEGGWDRKDIFSAYHGGQFGLYSQRMVRNHQWKYIWNATAEDELYHLEEDPWELNNRIDDPSCKKALTELRRRILCWMESTGDPLFNPWNQHQLT